MICATKPLARRDSRSGGLLQSASAAKQSSAIAVP